MPALAIEFALPENTGLGTLRPVIWALEAACEGLPGLRFRAFVLDRQRLVYRAYLVWDSRERLDAFLAAAPFRDAVQTLGRPQVRIDGVSPVPE